MQERNRRLPVTERFLTAALLLRAVALAAVEVPGFNGHWVDGAFRPVDHVHLGVAVSLRGGGVVAPAILEAETLSLPELMAALKSLVARARGGRLRSSELQQGTLTVTNLGDRGVESVLGVIYPPQVALVGFGTVSERLLVVDGTIAMRPLTTLTLAADHRATDGFSGSQLLTTVAEHLHHPEAL
jgi:pyruvate dehydrogenase E2 component (dihydrolipoamide acetyltransferase)